MKKTVIALLTALILAACSTGGDSINDRIITEFQVVGTTVVMNGEINARTYEQFVKLYEANPRITTIVEGGVPGSNDDETMIKLARYIRSKGLNTRLLAGSEIYSGGVDLFLAGKERTMERGAKVGVHSWSDGRKDAKDYPRDSKEHEMNRKYIEDMLGRDEFYWFTIEAAPADGIHMMSEAEILKYGLLTSGKILDPS